METIWKFETARFAVMLQWEPETCPDVSWADAETLARLDDGTYVCATFCVRVLCDDREIAADYLGNSIYADVREFYREHLGIRAKGRADGCNYGCYFSDMVRQAVRDARGYARDMPRVRD